MLNKRRYISKYLKPFCASQLELFVCLFVCLLVHISRTNVTSAALQLRSLDQFVPRTLGLSAHVYKERRVFESLPAVELTHSALESLSHCSHGHLAQTLSDRLFCSTPDCSFRFLTCRKKTHGGVSFKLTKLCMRERSLRYRSFCLESDLAAHVY